MRFSSADCASSLLSRFWGLCPRHLPGLCTWTQFWGLWPPDRLWPPHTNSGFATGPVCQYPGHWNVEDLLLTVWSSLMACWRSFKLDDTRAAAGVLFPPAYIWGVYLGNGGTVCLSVSNTRNSWTIRDIIMKFSGHGRKGGQVQNNNWKWLRRGARVVQKNVSNVLVFVDILVHASSEHWTQVSKHAEAVEDRLSKQNMLHL